MLTISKRPCQLGITINTRRELHGDEAVPACDIPIAGITLDANELNSFLGEPTAHRALFNRKGSHDEPLFPQLEPFQLKDKIEGAHVELTLNGETYAFSPCKLKGVTLQPMSGGVTLLSFKVQSSVDDMGDVVSNLVGHLDRTIEIAVSGGEAKPQDTKQQDLPINTFGDGEEPEAPKPRRRRNGHATAH